MARLHEFQGKKILAEHCVTIPRGRVAGTPKEAHDAAAEFGGRAIIKVQAWVTGRKDKGGVTIVDDPEHAATEAQRMLGMTFGNFPVSQVLVEELIDICDELFVSLTIDDAAQAPVLLLDCSGGTGIEDRASSVARVPIDVHAGVEAQYVSNVLSSSSIDSSLHASIVDTITKLVDIARVCETRSLEINPLVTTTDGRVVVADCRMTIDDYAVFRHPELRIDIARELDHPATPLERIAYEVEEADHRGTFYFAQLPTDSLPSPSARGAGEGGSSSRGLIGFHGAGGGGSMMSMDAVTSLPGGGFTIANFCDTSGNPSAAKVYRAARIILAQPGLTGYFGSGSGVASQEQYHSAYGLAKAFNEVNMPVPAVVRLGGNGEDRAVDILSDACCELPGIVEGYRKDDTPAFCAERFAALVESSQGAVTTDLPRWTPGFVDSESVYSFPINGGQVWIDYEHCDDDAARVIVDRSAGLLRLDESTGMPVLAVEQDEAAKKDSEFIALEIECLRAGCPLVFVDLPIAGLDG